MTRPREFLPLPSPDRKVYLWPKSKHPEIQRIYDWLDEHDWRYDSHYALWFTPAVWSYEGHGRLEHAEDGSWFRIQPPSVVVDGCPYRMDPLLSVRIEVDADV